MRAFVILFALILLVPQMSTAQIAKMPVYKYGNSAGERNFALYIPQSAQLRRQPVALFVVLHGCLQTAEVIASDTEMNRFADELGFVVAYPEQTNRDNPLACWNWFQPANLQRGTGELSIIAGIIEDLKGKLPINPNQVYVMGISAGGAMAANLAACYSDIVRGVAVASGLTYLSATSEVEAHQVMRSGPKRNPTEIAQAAINCTTKERARPLSVVNIQGTNDTVVGPVNSEAVIRSFAEMNDLADDGVANGSQTAQVLQTTRGEVPQGRRYLVETFGSAQAPALTRLVVEGMGHAWSGSKMKNQYTDPLGPPATLFILKHFSSFAWPQGSARKFRP